MIMKRMGARAVSGVVWAAVAACAVYWVLRLGPAVEPLSAPPAPAGAAPIALADLSRVLGASTASTPSAAPAPSALAIAQRLRLLGVIAPPAYAAPSRPGPGPGPALALISLDGGPARAYRVGARLDDSIWLLGVEPRKVRVGPRGGTPVEQVAEIELPAPAAGAAPQPGAPARAGGPRIADPAAAAAPVAPAAPAAPPPASPPVSPPVVPSPVPSSVPSASPEAAAPAQDAAPPAAPVAPGPLRRPSPLTR